MATETQMEAQRLVSISLTKMAQSRTQRTGISLHKSLLVATVLQKARFLCMEEVFRMVQANPVYQANNPCYEYEDEHLKDESNDGGGGGLDVQPDYSADDRYETYSDKENQAPALESPTYFDLDQKTSESTGRFRDRTTAVAYRPSRTKRTAADVEADEESTPKKMRRLLSLAEPDCDDSVFEEEDDEDGMDADPFSSEEEDERPEIGKTMDVDRITSLVSIFSFGGMTPANSVNGLDEAGVSNPGNSNACSGAAAGFHHSNLTRSASTPDLCSAQAKEADSIQQRPFIAMTV